MIGRKIVTLACALIIASVASYTIAANYALTVGAGTTFGSVVVAGVNYAQHFVCDLTTPAQCAAVSAGGAVKVDASATTQPVSAASLPLPAGAATSALQTTGNTSLTTINTTLGSPFQAGGSIGNTTFAATESGTWTVQPGNTANTTPWLVSVPTWAGGTLGAMANYGTSPGAVLVPGVNAFVTNATPGIANNADGIASVAAGATSPVPVNNYNYVYNGTTWDRGRSGTTTGSFLVNGAGTAGAASGGILTVQGVAAMTKLLVTPDSVALPANQSVNVAQFGGTSTSTGQVATSVAPVTATNTALVVDLRPDSPGIIALGTNTAANSVPVVMSTTPTIANGSGIVAVPSTETLAALTPVVTAALESNHVIKASAGNFYSGYVTTGAVAGFFLLANSTTAPTAGGAAIAPLACVIAPANATTSLGGAIPIRASTGITLVFSTSGCLTNTASATAFFSGMAD